MRITASRDGGDAYVFTVAETGVDLDEEELTLSLQSVDVRYGSNADLQHHSHLCLLLGAKRTLNVRFFSPNRSCADDVRFRG